MESSSNESQDMKSLLTSTTVSRLMLPNDANIYGNVHGGSTLNLIEEAGAIIATRYCNNSPSRDADVTEPCVAVLARIEHVDFLQPMHIGEVADLAAQIVYTAPHSLQVRVQVWVENILKGTKRLTNRSRLWYVPLSVEDPDKVIAVPPMEYADNATESRGRIWYEHHKLERSKHGLDLSPIGGNFGSTEDAEPQTVQYSQTTLSWQVGPNDVSSGGYCRGGVVLKVMDECAGITAAKHCHNNAVTACLNATNFHRKVSKGALVTVYGRATFNSSRSIEIEVIVEFEVMIPGGGFHKERAIDAFFTYVAIDEDGHAVPMPPLKVISDEEKKRFEEGRIRYERRKLQRKMSSAGES